MKIEMNPQEQLLSGDAIRRHIANTLLSDGGWVRFIKELERIICVAGQPSTTRDMALICAEPHHLWEALRAVQTAADTNSEGRVLHEVEVIANGTPIKLNVTQGGGQFSSIKIMALTATNRSTENLDSWEMRDCAGNLLFDSPFYPSAIPNRIFLTLKPGIGA